MSDVLHMSKLYLPRTSWGAHTIPMPTPFVSIVCATEKQRRKNSAILIELCVVCNVHRRQIYCTCSMHSHKRQKPFDIVIGYWRSDTIPTYSADAVRLHSLTHNESRATKSCSCSSTSSSRIKWFKSIFHPIAIPRTQFWHSHFHSFGCQKICFQQFVVVDVVVVVVSIFPVLQAICFCVN